MAKKKDPGPIVLVPCKRGRDQKTAGTSCSSKKAYKLSEDGAKLVRFKCVECGHTWTIPVGGQFTAV